VKKWELLEQGETPDGKALTLWKHDGTYTIRVGGLDLMSTRQHASEESLAHWACGPFKEHSGTRVLVGGLGFGFTLRAALEALPPKCEVVVAELLPAVVLWNRKYQIAVDAMDDWRVTIRQTDVFTCIEEKPSHYDCILLDVDNGAAALSDGRNARLYRREGLGKIHSALKPGGCAAFWSAVQDPAFARLLEQADFRVETRRVRAHATAGSRHSLFFGYKR